MMALMAKITHILFRRRTNMTTIPITSIALATGSTENITVVDQGGAPLPDSTIAWNDPSGHYNSAYALPQDTVNGGFLFTAVSVASGTLTATHIPSGKTADIPYSITNPVTAISFVTTS
jgi:hypothetical protein